MHPLAELWTWFADTSCAGYSPLYERNSRAVAASPEMIDLIRAHTPVYVSDDLFDRSAIVRVVDAKPPYIRAWAHGRWGNDLLTLPRFNG